MFKRFRDTITGLYTRSRDPATTVAETDRREPNSFVVIIIPPTGPRLKSRVRKDDVVIFGPRVLADEAERMVERWTAKQ